MNTPTRTELIRTLFDTMDTMKRGMYAQMQAINRTLPIPRPQLELLTTIRHTQPISFKDLAKQLYLTPGAISQQAEGLEQQALIIRRIDAKDRRIQCLEVTPKGLELLEDVEKRRRSILEKVLHELSDEELEIWVRVHRKLIKQFQSEITKSEKKES
jgi:DNA-binding MarR family transcriptional regulator